MAKNSGGGTGGGLGRGGRGGGAPVAPAPVTPPPAPAPPTPPPVTSPNAVPPQPTADANGIQQPRFGIGAPTNPATPFTNMPAFQEFGSNRDVRSSVTSGDAYLESLVRDQGWANPRDRTVVTSKDLDDRVAGGALEVFRTVKPDRGKTANQLLDEIRSGPYYGGNGIYGNGMYSATDYNHSKNSYGGSRGETVRMVLKPGARVIDWADLQRVATQNQQYHASLNTPRVNGQSPYRALSKMANLAAWLGYDAIRKPGGNSGTSRANGGHDYYNILNPTAVWIENVNQGQPKTGYAPAPAAPRARRTRRNNTTP